MLMLFLPECRQFQYYDWYGNHKAAALKAQVVEQRAKSQQEARTAEHLANQAKRTVADNLAKDTQKGTARSRAAGRLRHAAATQPAATTATAASGGNAAPVIELRDDTRGSSCPAHRRRQTDRRRAKGV